MLFLFGGTGVVDTLSQQEADSETVEDEEATNLVLATLEDRSVDEEEPSEVSSGSS